MSTTTTLDGVQHIGEIAGRVWHSLSANGTISLAKLARDIDAPRDIVMQAVGWLAREGKITVDENSRGRTVALIAEEMEQAA